MDPEGVILQHSPTSIPPSMSHKELFIATPTMRGFLDTMRHFPFDPDCEELWRIEALDDPPSRIPATCRLRDPIYCNVMAGYDIKQSQQ